MKETNESKEVSGRGKKGRKNEKRSHCYRLKAMPLFAILILNIFDLFPLVFPSGLFIQLNIIANKILHLIRIQ